MDKRRFVMIDGNEATATVAHLSNEVLAIYPITPSSDMGQWADAWAATGRKNIFGAIPDVVEMQSEAGAAGAVHGALQGGALTSTFTASQGLLLMIPNMFKIAGELTPTVFHVSARTVATHALSIFGDHSDVMACRGTGWGMLCAGSVQEAQDMALIATSASLEARVPFVHFFDGFRTSHEVSKIEQVTEDDVREMIDMDLVAAHRMRSLSPEHPVIRGTAQNPDHFFQAREACNPFYVACPGIVQKTMDKYAKLVGREYHLFDYVGAEDAERVIIIMGSACGAAEEAVQKLAAAGEKVGMVKVRLYRPFDCSALVAALPSTVKAIAAMDRTKEPGAAGEPLYQDVIAAVAEEWQGEQPLVIGGRYALSSKEITPAMFKGIFDELASDAPKRHFTIGINDDVTHLSIDFDPTFSTQEDDVTQAVIYGLGSDGTVGASKASVKIIGEHTDGHAQGYFVYDSKKAGSLTVSHLRFSPRPILGSYLITEANFVGCNQWTFVEKLDMLSVAKPGATFLLNSPYGPDEVWDQLPVEMQKDIIDKGIKLYVIDAYKVAEEAGMGLLINTIMQTCFFQLGGFLPAEEAIGHIKKSIEKAYAKKGTEVVAKNFAAVDAAIANLHEVKVPAEATSTHKRLSAVPDDAPEFVRNVLGLIIANRGNEIPVSAFDADGTFPTATSQYEKRSIAIEIPIWDHEMCIQCGRCSLVCPHAAIRMKAIKPEQLEGAPEGFATEPWKTKEYTDRVCRIQVFPDDCTGCGACVESCPAKKKEDPSVKAINLRPKLDHLEQERANVDFFLSIPDIDRSEVKIDSVKGSQLLRPLFEFSGACAGCGETPYVKLLTQFVGDRLTIANATGCSSIYGGNLPCHPYATDENGRGPAWGNSLFEDNAEYGLGMRLAADQQESFARMLVEHFASQVGADLVKGILDNPQETEADINKQRQLVAELREKLETINCGCMELQALKASAEYLVRRSIWCVGGDGWAYDIGFGGLDHVIASGRNINILVMDTEVYSNTGGQASKATPRGAVAKFAASGKPARKKDLGLIAMSYGNVFVGQIAMGANPAHAIRTMLAAESYPGSSLIIAYSHCIAHGIEMVMGMEQQKKAVACGYWPLYTYDPRNATKPMTITSKAPNGEYREFALSENRFRTLQRSNPDASEELLRLGEDDIDARWSFYEQLAAVEHKD